MWLQTHNLLYQDVVIKYYISRSMPNEFIPKNISLRVVIMINDISKRKSYNINWTENNDENDLHRAVDCTNMNN